MISISTFIWAVRGTPVRLPACLDRFSINIVCPCKSLEGHVSAEKLTCDMELFLRDVFTFFLFVSMNNQFNLKQCQCSGLGVLHRAGRAWNGVFRCGAFLSDPSPIIAMPCHCVSRLVEFCSSCWICHVVKLISLSCLMNLSKSIPGFF